MPTLQELLEGIICPRCGREDTYQIIEGMEVVKVGDDTVSVPVTVGECSDCGERLLDQQTTQRLFDAAEAVRHGQKDHLRPVGTAYAFTE